MRYFIFLMTIISLLSCNKYNDDKEPYTPNHTSGSTPFGDIAYCRYYIDGVSSSIVASESNADQRYFIGYGSGNIINTDTVFLSYSCNYLRHYGTSHMEIEIEFFKMEKKFILQEYNNSHYYKNNAYLVQNILFTGRKKYLQDIDDFYEAGVKITYRDMSGNYWTSINAEQDNSFFTIGRTKTVRNDDNKLEQKIEGSFRCTLTNNKGSITKKLSGSFLGYYANPI